MYWWSKLCFYMFLELKKPVIRVCVNTYSRRKNNVRFGARDCKSKHGLGNRAENIWNVRGTYEHA